MKSTWEWGIVHHKTPDELHRGPMTESTARDWIHEFEELEGGRPGAFLLVVREVSEWRLDSDAS